MNCPKCHTVNPEAAKFCMNCGTPLAGVTPASARWESDTRPLQSLDKFIPRELQAKFEAARANDAMVGERRVITMLFCDVKGSTAAAEQVDPETWTEIMNGIFEHMIRPIYKYEGTVPRLMGDAILAFFGAPIAHEDDPQRAVLAGLEIQQGIQPYAEQIRLKHGLGFALRVGINTGLVVVGQIGSDLRMEYTAIGDAINLAARMEQTAEPGTVQVSEETYKLVAPFFEFESLGKVEVKGKSMPISTYRPLGVKKMPGQTRGLEGLSSPLVGREAQLVFLDQRVKGLAGGTGAFVSVTGEAGLGKSSLIRALQESRANARELWLKGESLSYARSISYFPWRQVIRQSVDAQEGDSAAQIREKLRYSCDCCRLPGGDIPFLEALLAVESEESLRVVAGYQGEALIQMMVDATQGFLCGLAMDQPLVIVFDDLHWADEASLNLLYRLADLIKNHAILFICMLRPDSAARGWDAIQMIKEKPGFNDSEILLQPLQADQTDTLLNNLLGVRDLPKNLRDLIVEKAEGNPFFIEELIRSLIETKQIVRQNSHWAVTGQAATITLPNTLRGVLSARIDRLPEGTKYVLQNAAVIGRSFDLRVLRRLTGLNGGLDAHVQVLEEASLIEPLREEYSFRHVLIQESAYESILIKKRAELHRQIGETLEELHADRIEEFAPLLAHHFYHAQDPRSLPYDLMAGKKAAHIYANVEAAAHFRRALEVAIRDKSDSGQTSQLYAQLGSVLELDGRHREALQNYDDMQSYGREQADRSIEMSALMAKATIYSTFTELHDPKLSEQMLIGALEISREIGDRAAQAKLNWNLMLTYLFSKHLDQALPYGEIALALAREGSDREQLAFVLNDLCRLYTCRGEFDKAHTVVREARELWQAQNNQAMLVDNLGSEAEASFNNCEFDEALQFLQQALPISEEIENLWGQSYISMLMAFVYFETGQLGRGIQIAERGVKLGSEAGMMAINSMRCELAWVYAYCGAFDRGFEVIAEATRIADEKQRAWKAFPQAAKVRMHLLQGDVEAAEITAGKSLLQPISIPYARYTIFLCLANIELAAARGEYAKALTLVEELLGEVSSLVRVDIPELLRWKGRALFALKRFDEADQILKEACLLAKRSGSNLHLWAILADLADVHAMLGNQEEAQANRAGASMIIDQIAESLREVGLRESFLNQPRVQKVRL